MDKNCCVTKSGEYRAQGDKTTSGFYSGVSADEAAVPTLAESRSLTGVRWDSGETLIDG